MSQIRALHGNVLWQSRPTRASLHPRIPLVAVQPCPNSPPEHTTRVCAEDLAARLTAWWHERGFPTAQFWPVECRSPIDKAGDIDAAPDRHKRYDIRSNLINGIPPEETR